MNLSEKVRQETWPLQSDIRAPPFLSHPSTPMSILPVSVHCPHSQCPHCLSHLSFLLFLETHLPCLVTNNTFLSFFSFPLPPQQSLYDYINSQKHTFICSYTPLHTSPIKSKSANVSADVPFIAICCEKCSQKAILHSEAFLLTVCKHITT